MGEIVEVGEGIDDSEIGNRVGTYGTHSEFIVSDLEDCRPIPPEISDSEAVFFTIAEIAMNAIRKANLEYGESVAVFGLGLVGQLTVQFCQFAGARREIGLDI